MHASMHTCTTAYWQYVKERNRSSQDTCVRKRKSRHMYGQKSRNMSRKHTVQLRVSHVYHLYTYTRQLTPKRIRPNNYHIIQTHTQQTTQHKQTPTQATYVRTTYVSTGSITIIFNFRDTYTYAYVTTAYG